ncbi:Pam17-domain-containing protein [Tothia fuscella]|uniref:Presequence translocated-associated motor subunit PAM17 n=1 Tax=Tothia fuscella TaxID=1048955 RepID=A0A9P4NZ29_9PEZI|nr:Pam17-domain-containing protein [Tothia fuscella]
MLCRALPVRSATTAARCFKPLQQCTFSTSVTRQCLSPQTTITRSIRKPLQNTRTILFKRNNSTTSTTPSIIDTTTTTTSTPDPDAQLTWNRFLALRKTRRRISLVASIISAAGFTSAGIIILTQQDIDSMGAQMLGLDPIIVLGLSTVACGLVGWLIGPFFGNAVFNMWYKKLGGQIALKERAFYARIKKHRVDPTSSSMQNPVPDYYGEKIGSVTDYRRWLKDQRAFNLKRGKML